MYSGRSITNFEFDNRLSMEFPQFLRQSQYINSKTPIIISCRICRRFFKIKPKSLKSLKCDCLKRNRDYSDKISSKSITPLENYLNIRHKIYHKCLKCLNVFKTSPKSIINSKIGCPSCSGKKFSISHYKSILPKNIILLSDEYNGSQFKYDHKCFDCGNVFQTKPNYILHMGTNCPFCSSSKGERIVSSFLDHHNIRYVREFSVNIDSKNYRFDFYLEDYNSIIEYDGVQHFKPIYFFGGDIYHSKIVESDSIKDKWCLDNGINIIRIPYYSDVYFYLNSIFYYA